MEINLGADTAGLYALETATGEDSSKESAGESDYDGKPGKKEGKLGSKKKDKEDKKKEKDKDKGYAALEGDSSPDESEMEAMKSPFKGKKRSFKFSSRKDKKSKEEEKEKKKDKERKLSKESSSPKEVRLMEDSTSEMLTPSKADKKAESSEKKKEKKDKEKEKEKKEKEVKVKDKETKGKEIKNKLKIKDKKKPKSLPSLEDDLPIFGVPLELAVQRGRCHDGIDLPAVVRCSIDYIEEHGLQQEGIYRSSGLKTRVVELRKAYNNRENVSLQDVDPPVVASLLKQYLRELPDNILTNELLSKFEEASAIKDGQQQEQAFRSLIQQLPSCNLLLLSWLMVHMGHVVEKEKYNKMNVQNLSIVLCPTLNLTHRVMASLFAHSRALFSATQLTRYIPPLSGFGVILPEELSTMAVELKKQESLLAQIHGEMSVGSVAKHREEQLWEAQRIVTQLKRQLKHQAPSGPTTVTNTVQQDRAPSTESRNNDEEELRLELALPADVPEEEEEVKEASPPLASPSIEETVPNEVVKEISASPPSEPTPLRIDVVDQGVEPSKVTVQLSPQHVTVIEVSPRKKPTELFLLDADKELELTLMIENEERAKIIQQLNEAIERERRSVEHLQELLAETALTWTDSEDEEINEEGQEQLLAEVLRENRQLEEQNVALQLQIEEAREVCLKYRVQLRLKEERAKLVAITTGVC